MNFLELVKARYSARKYANRPVEAEKLDYIIDGNVIITGGSISGWTPGNEEEDIVINGEEINPQTNNML